LGERWGNASSPGYGTLSDYPFMKSHTASEKRRERARLAWGASLTSVDSVVNVFVQYVQGEESMYVHLHGSLVVPGVVDVHLPEWQSFCRLWYFKAPPLGAERVQLHFTERVRPKFREKHACQRLLSTLRHSSCATMA
jgi:hypothetical protein